MEGGGEVSKTPHSPSGRVSLPPLKPLSTATASHGNQQPQASWRSNRVFSRKLQAMLKKQATAVESGDQGGRRERIDPRRNWRQLTDRQLVRLTPIERSRYMAYEPVPKPVQEHQIEALKRVRVTKALQKEQPKGATLCELIETERNGELVGQLKASEARHRIRLMRIRYERSRDEELNHLIASQSSSIEAVRLKTFVPRHHYPLEVPQLLHKHEHIRCEALLEDEMGLTVNRTA